MVRRLWANKRHSERTAQPQVLADLLNIRALVRVDDQAAREEVERSVARAAVRAAAGRLEHNAARDRVVLSWERRRAREEVREQDAERPDLGRRRAVRLPREDLRRGVGGGAEEEVVVRARLVGVGDDRAAKVDEFDLRVSRQWERKAFKREVDVPLGRYQ